MIVLALETATELVGVAVGDLDGTRCALWATGRRRHAETLVPAVSEVLGHAGLGLDDVGLVAVDVGPGLFTGLRVGVATAKGLAQGLGLEVLALGSLEVLARAAADAGHVGTVVSVVDARRSEVFAAAFEVGREGPAGPLVERGPARLVAPADLVAEVAALAGPGGASGPVLVLGDGARRYAGLLQGLAGVRVAGASLSAPPPGVMVPLALERLAQGVRPLPPAQVVPRYLREADARINWVQRQAPGPSQGSGAPPRPAAG